MLTESFSQQPLSTVAPSYLYWQYSDDDSLQAFVQSYNEIAQGYLDWFNTTPFGLYTASTISASLLDWVGLGLYGYPRPSIVTPPVRGPIKGPWGTAPFGTGAFAMRSYQSFQQGSVYFVNDDIYKRALTWHLYLGDGKQMSIDWMKRRIARFIYGANGSDITVSDLESIDLQFPLTHVVIGDYGSAAAFGTVPFGGGKKTGRTNRIATITLATNAVSQQFKSLFDGGFLAIPFQIKFKVNLS
jgi:hypothetical protein